MAAALTFFDPNIEAKRGSNNGSNNEIAELLEYQTALNKKISLLNAAKEAKEQAEKILNKKEQSIKKQRAKYDTLSSEEQKKLIERETAFSELKQGFTTLNEQVDSLEKEVDKMTEELQNHNHTTFSS